MKKIFFYFLMAITLQMSAQSTTYFSKPLELGAVPASESKADSVLVRGTDKKVKFVPRSEFASGGGSQTLQNAVEGGTLASFDSGENTVDLLTQLTGSRRRVSFKTSTSGIGISQFSVYDQAITMSNGTGLNVNGGLNISSGLLNLTQSNSGATTTIDFDTPVVGSRLHFPAPTVEGDYTFALKSDIPTINPASATQSGIVDNTSLQELGGVDKLINLTRIGRGGGNVNSNTVVGRDALFSNTTGGFNTAVGRNVLYSNLTGASNSAFGYASLALNTTGQRNVAFGGSSLAINTTGSFNSVFGSGAGAKQTTANYNILIGFQSGRAITTGSNNLLIENTINDGITTGSGNVILNPSSVSVTGITTGNNNVVIGAILGVIGSGNDNVLIGTGGNVGGGIIAFSSITSGLTTVPRQTNALITGDSTGKSVITKEYLNTSLPVLTTLNIAPTSATDTGVKGDIRIDSNYVYICVDTNTWKRSALSVW